MLFLVLHIYVIISVCHRPPHHQLITLSEIPSGLSPGPTLKDTSQTLKSSSHISHTVKD